MKTVTCMRCGCDGLVWRVSKAGNKYLGRVQEIEGDESARIIKVVYPAHYCEDYLEARARFAENIAADEAFEAGFRGEALRAEVARNLPRWLQHLADRDAQKLADLAALDAATVKRGSEVTVIRGRKIAKGTTGVVFWVAPEIDQYGHVRAGVETAAGDKFFINVDYLEVAGAPASV